MQGEHPDDQALPRPFWDALRHDEPDPRAVERAYQRFIAVPQPWAPPRLMLARWLLGGFAFGWGVVFAATGDPLFGARVRATPVVTMGSAAAAPSARRASPGGARKPALSDPGGARSAATVEASTAPSPVEPTPARSSVQREAASSLAAPAPPSASPHVDPTWQRAAVALRAHDYDAAAAAFSDLESHGTSSERDAASLALAEVLLAQGRTAAARARLEALSTSATAAVTRDKARALLTPSAPVNRSTEAVPATQ